MMALANNGIELPGLISRSDLHEVALALPAAEQARWPPEAFLLFLLNWALDNRGHTFERYLPEAWPTVHALMAQWSLPMSPSPVSAAALCQIRQKFGVAPFEALHQRANQRLIQHFDGLCRRDGFRLWAVDGSWINLPSEASLEKEFGRPSGGEDGEMRPLPQALFVSLELVNIGWFFDHRLMGCNDAEMQAGRELTEQLGPGDLLLGDRLFFDTLWISNLRSRDVELLLRVTSARWKSFCKDSQERIESLRSLGVVDCPVMLKIDTDHKGCPRGGLLPLRYIERPPEHPGQETMRMITSLPRERLPVEESCALYGERWGIETQYRFFKGQDHLPVVLSRKPETVRQEVLVRMMAHNWVRGVQAEACLKVRAADDGAFPPCRHNTD